MNENPQANKSTPGAVNSHDAARLAPEAKTGASASQTQVASLKDGLDLFGKLLFGLAGLCYVLGVVIVTIHLRQYGVNSLDLPQLHYITAGVWVVLPIAIITTLAVLGLFMAATQFDDLRRKRGVNKWIDRISFTLGIIMALMLALKFFWGNTGIEFSWRRIVLIPLMGIFSSLIIVGGAMSLKNLSRTPAFGDVVQSVGALLLGLVLFAAYVLLFATHTYQAIPWATGGGRASQVRLVITPDAKPYVESLKIAMSGQPRSGVVETGSVKLLLTTEKQLIVINEESKAVSLPAEIVKGITYDK